MSDRKIKILIVDDEAPARQILNKYISGLTDVQIVGEAETGEQAVQQAWTLRPDLAFVDIQMSGISGLEAAMRFPKETGIIFVTAYDEYAIKAFELHAFDYLLKPIMKDRLIQSLETFLQKKISIPQEAFSEVLKMLSVRALPSRIANEYLETITLRDIYEFIVLPVWSVEFIHIEHGMVKVYADKSSYGCDLSLKKLSERLDPTIFCRIHRNTIVNKSKVKKILPRRKTAYQVEMKSGVVLEISRDYLKQFKKEIGWLL